jgi:hypothetical protein
MSTEETPSASPIMLRVIFTRCGPSPLSDSLTSHPAIVRRLCGLLALGVLLANVGDGEACSRS